MCPSTAPTCARSSRAASRPLRIAAGLALVLAMARPSAADAQVVAPVAGAVGGAVTGTWVTLAIYVTKARFGRYIFSVDEVVTPTIELLPVAVLPTAGTWLGIESPNALGRAAGWGGIGFLGGAVVGSTAGHLIWSTDEGRWAGAIIGSAVGLVTGAVLGARDGLRDDDREAMPVSMGIRIPVGWRP